MAHSRSIQRNILTVAAAAIVLGSVSSSAFAQNVALHKPISDGSGAYGTSPYYEGQFNAFQVTDGRINEPTQNNFWLSREDFSGVGYFTVDLGDQYSLSQISLRNTHNSKYNDRGTNGFEILGANAINSNHDLISPVSVLTGNVTQRSGADGETTDISADVFSAAGQFRYLRVRATSAYGAFNNPGLNEIEVNGTRVPSNPAHAPNVALNKPIVANSGTYGGIAGFEASNVTDGSTADVFSDNNPNSSTYWLTQDNGGAGSFFVVDLGDQFNITGLGIRNTHNWQYNDRGSAAFEVRGSDTIDGTNLASAPVILSGGLPNSSGDDPNATIEAFEFAAANGLAAGNYRYLRFTALSAVPGNNGGLNEFEVYGTAVPEPASLAVIGFASLAFFRRSRA